MNGEDDHATLPQCLEFLDVGSNPQAERRLENGITSKTDCHSCLTYLLTLVDSRGERA